MQTISPNLISPKLLISNWPNFICRLSLTVLSSVRKLISGFFFIIHKKNPDIDEEKMKKKLQQFADMQQHSFPIQNSIHKFFFFFRPKQNTRRRKNDNQMFGKLLINCCLSLKKVKTGSFSFYDTTTNP